MAAHTDNPYAIKVAYVKVQKLGYTYTKLILVMINLYECDMMQLYHLCAATS